MRPPPSDHMTSFRWTVAFAAALVLAGACTCEPETPLVEEGEVPALCFDDIDNDADGLTDCRDPGCSRIPACTGEREAECDDGLDNDANGFADCADFGCATHPACRDASAG